MIERIIEYSVRNRLVVILLAAGVAAWGLYSLARTPVDAIPDLSENQVIVFADWMGRSPQEVEDQVTYPLSVNLQGLAGVKAVRSTSEFNFSMINIIFEDDTDFYFARQRVLERLSVAETFLPEGVAPYLAPDATALGQIFWYTVEGEGRDLGDLRAIQDWYVRYQLNAVPGVAEVASVGGFVRSYEISVDPNRLRGYGVTLGQIVEAVEKSNSAVGGNVVIKNDAEYLVRGVGWIRDLQDIRNTVLASRGGTPVTVGQVATVQESPQPRRSILEKNGREAVGGVVVMRFGENPLEITERIHAKIQALSAGLPEGVRIVPFYERTRLIRDAIDTLARTLTEEMIIASLAILLILAHLGSAFIVVLTLPLAVLISFILMRLFGIPSNIMSLSGIAISIGVLVDAAIVMVENGTHELTDRFGNGRVRGDTRETILKATKLVGRPIFLSVMIMLISFLPVFALSGMEGKMFHPLAFTKSFAMVGVALLAITLVPALMPTLLRGRLRSEMENPIVRSFIEIYRPVLSFLLKHPKPFLLSFVVLLGIGYNLSRHLGREFMPPLDEGSIMDMPVTIPSVSVTKAGDDMRARDAVLRSFPEVESVVGKVGRAETPTDPAPPDMVETVVNLRPKDWWPKRSIRYDDTSDEAEAAMEDLQRRGLALSAPNEDERAALVNEAAMASAERMDALLRRHSLQSAQTHAGSVSEALVATGLARLLDQAEKRGALQSIPSDGARRALARRLADAFGTSLAADLGPADVGRFLAAARDSASGRGWIQDRADLFQARRTAVDGALEPMRALIRRERPSFEESLRREMEKTRDRMWRRHAKVESEALVDLAVSRLPRVVLQEVEKSADGRGWLDRPPDEGERDAICAARSKHLAKNLFLSRKTKSEIVQEMDTALQVPGWGNIWTQPIINRVDMLATGVRTMVGVKVFGDDLYRIQEISERIAAELKAIPGAVDVFPDQIVGENYLEIDIDREKAARYGVAVDDIQMVIETAVGGMPITQTVEGRRRFPVRVRYAGDFRADEEAIGRILVNGMGATNMGGSDMGGAVQVPLSDVASVRVVEGPSMIKSENGLLRSYVQLNVRGRDVVGFVEEAQRVIQSRVELPPGYYIEWSGQFEHQVRAKKTLSIVFPMVIALILLILYITFHDIGHALLMVLAVPGALVGGVIFQLLFGFDFSVAVWVGYIAAFGMATETGIVMMVYLRDALERRGGLAAIRHPSEIREAVIQGAVHRLRPKLLTEGVAIVGLMPMLWAHGTGAEVMRPMVAPVLGGLLVADEVIDLLIPVLFHGLSVRRWRKMHGRAAVEESG